MTWVLSLGLLVVTFSWEWFAQENGPYLVPIGLSEYIGYIGFHDDGRFEVYGPAIGPESAEGTYAPF